VVAAVMELTTEAEEEAAEIPSFSRHLRLLTTGPSPLKEAQEVREPLLEIAEEEAAAAAEWCSR